MTKTFAFIATAAAALAAAAPAAAEPLAAVSTTSTGPKLLRFDSASPGTVKALPITGIGAGERVRGIDLRPANGLVYLATVTVGGSLSTYVLNVDTGQASLVGATAAVIGAADVATGYDFNPTVDRIRYVNENDENARLQPDSAQRADTAPNDTDLSTAQAGGQNLVAGAYDRNLPPTQTGTTLYALNGQTASLATIGGINSAPSPNGGLVADVGPLGVTPVGDAGFDISGATQVAYAAITDSVSNLSKLYTINLTTGVATLVGTIGAPQGVPAGTALVDSLTAVPAPTPGPQGPQGTTGPAGPQGDPGTNGSNGTSGTNGSNGAAGPQGPAGPAGPQGPAGADGRFGAVLGSASLSGRARRSLAVRFAVTRNATVRIEIRKGSRLVSSRSRSVSGGRNSLSIRLPSKVGRYTLRLRASTSGGVRSSDSARLTVRR